MEGVLSIEQRVGEKRPCHSPSSHLTSMEKREEPWGPSLREVFPTPRSPAPGLSEGVTPEVGQRLPTVGVIPDCWIRTEAAFMVYSSTKSEGEPLQSQRGSNYRIKHRKCCS